MTTKFGEMVTEVSMNLSGYTLTQDRSTFMTELVILQQLLPMVEHIWVLHWLLTQ